MSEHFASLGAGVVLDPSNLTEGCYVAVGDEVMIVSRIEGNNVYFRPVLGWDLWCYRLRQNRVAIVAFFIALLIIAAFCLVR